MVPAVLPFFHIYGMTVLMNGAVYRRARLVTLPRFDLAEYLRVVEQHRATVLFVAPPIALALAKHPAAAASDLSGVRVLMSGAAPFDEKLAGAVAARMPAARVLQGYGMSEMSPVSHVVPIDRADVSPGSVGMLVPNMAARVVDPATGEEIEVPAEGVSVPGELLCAGPNVMVGYLGDEAATRDTLEPDGFLHTGDIVTVDAGGTFWVVDRLKELIKHKGYQVAPAELEALLLTHPGYRRRRGRGGAGPGVGGGAQGVRRARRGERSHGRRRAVLRGRTGRAVQEGAGGGVRRRGPEVRCGEDPAQGAARPLTAQARPVEPLMQRRGWWGRNRAFR